MESSLVRATGYVVGLEAKRGVEFFADDGDIMVAVNEAIEVWLKAALQGTPPEPDTGEHDADDI